MCSETLSGISATKVAINDKNKQVDKWINNLRDHAALFITNDIKRKSHYANIELIYFFYLATTNRLIIIIIMYYTFSLVVQNLQLKCAKVELKVSG